MKKVFPVFLLISLLAVVSFGFIQADSSAPFATFRICCDTDCSPSGCQDSTWTEYASDNKYLNHKWALDFFGPGILGETYEAFNACRSGWTGDENSRYHCSRCDTEDESDTQPCHYDDVKRTCGWWRTNVGAQVDVSPNSLDFDTTSSTKSFTVSNVGFTTLEWSASGNRGWITGIADDYGTIGVGGDGTSVNVTVSRTSLTQTECRFETNYGNINVVGQYNSKVVLIEVEIVIPSAPNSLTILNAGSWGSSPQLSWSNVACDAGYKVYRKINSGSWSQIASPTLNSYTDSEVTLLHSGDLIYYYVKAWNGAGNSPASSTISTYGNGNQARLDGQDLQLQLLNELPKEYGLLNSYPNPGNPGTSIKYQLPEVGQVDLKVVNIRGEVVRTLITGQQSAGTHEIHWDGRNEQGLGVGTGMYIFVLHAGGKVFNKKYSLVK